MPRRTNHPLKTLVLLLGIAGLGYLAYEYIHVRQVLTPEPDEYLPHGLLDEAREAILEEYDDDSCLLGVDRIRFRPRDEHYRVNLTVYEECRRTAPGMCRHVAALVGEIVDRRVGVFAYDSAGNEMAKHIE